MEEHGEPRLAEGLDFADLSQYAASLGNQQMSSIRRVEVRRDHAIDRSRE